MFTVEIAADIFGVKTNFELEFSSRPSLQELHQRIEAVFSAQIANTRPSNVPAHSFQISKLRILDEANNKWVPFNNESQLTSNSQLYAFQPENAWHKETQNPIPPAVRPPPLCGTEASAFPRSGAAVSSSTVRPTTISSSLGAAASLTGRGASIPRSLRTTGGTTGPSSVSRSTALVTTPHGEVSFNEKIRIVFSEFDLKGNRSIELADMKQGFQNLGLDFSSSTVEDLFERADTNKDGRISFTEFEHFAHLYPIMRDIIYIRSKAFWEEDQMNKAIQNERETVAKAESALDAASRLYSTSQNDVAQAKQAVQAAEAELQDHTDRMRDLALELEERRREKEDALKEKRERERLLHEVREKETGARKDLQDLSREAEKVERRLTSLVSDATTADEKVRQLQKALEDAKKAADRAHVLAEQGTLEVEKARERERDASLELDVVVREIPKVEDAVRLADRNVSSTEQVLRELDNVGKQLGRDADEAARRREASELAVVDMQERANLRKNEVERARQQVEEREKQVKARENELEEHRRQRELASQYERVLVEKELRLRETRDSLEQNEMNLHSEASEFLSKIRAGGASVA